MNDFGSVLLRAREATCIVAKRQFCICWNTHNVWVGNVGCLSATRGGVFRGVRPSEDLLVL